MKLLEKWKMTSSTQISQFTVITLSLGNFTLAFNVLCVCFNDWQHNSCFYNWTMVESIQLLKGCLYMSN